MLTAMFTVPFAAAASEDTGTTFAVPKYNLGLSLDTNVEWAFWGDVAHATYEGARDGISFPLTLATRTVAPGLASGHPSCTAHTHQLDAGQRGCLWDQQLDCLSLAAWFLGGVPPWGLFCGTTRHESLPCYPPKRYALHCLRRLRPVSSGVPPLGALAKSFLGHTPRAVCPGVSASLDHPVVPPLGAYLADGLAQITDAMLLLLYNAI